jgi:YidC/Oxa1 family membrane protein insertase
VAPESRRIVIAAGLALGILLVFQWLFPQKPSQRRHASEEARREQTAAQAPPAAPSAGQPAGASPAPAPVPSAPEETVTLENETVKAVFTTDGGALKSLELKGRKFQREVGGKTEQVDLVRWVPGMPHPGALVASAELGGTGELAGDPAALASWRIAARDARSVTFEGTVGSVQARKRFFLSERPHEIGLELQATAERRGGVTLLYPGFLPPDAPKPGFFSGGAVVETLTPICRAGAKTARFDGKEAKEAKAGTAAWIGLDQHYFVSALLATPEVGECIFFKGPVAGEAGVALAMPVDGKLDVSFKIYAGPKQAEVLRGYGRDLQSAVDYGAIVNLFASFVGVILWVMRRLQAVVGNWGVSIILLTVIVKGILYPLTAKSMQSMNEMRKLQPEIEKLKAKFGSDKEKLNMAVMQLYQQHKVNPLGGCLPMLIQMPIWFALYATLQTSVELYREPFLWLKDLTAHDPYYILPLAMGATSFLMQKLSPQPADSTQAKMLLYVMPVFFTFIMLRLPAGLTLYILVNNVLSIGQQQWLMRRQPAGPAPAKAG